MVNYFSAWSNRGSVFEQRFRFGRNAVLCMLVAIFTQPAFGQTPPPSPWQGGVESLKDSVIEKNVSQIPSATERTLDWVDRQIPPQSAHASNGDGLNLFSDPKSKRAAIKTVAALVLVMSLFFLVVFVWRLKPGATSVAKKRTDQQPLAVLGQVPFVHGQELQLIRVGMRLLLVSTSPAGSQVLAEITDPNEVLHLESAIQQESMDSLFNELQTRATRAVQARSQVPDSSTAGIKLGSGQAGRPIQTFSHGLNRNSSMHSGNHTIEVPNTSRTLLEA